MPREARTAAARVTLRRVRTVLAALAVVGCSKPTDPVRVAASSDLSGAFSPDGNAILARYGLR